MSRVWIAGSSSATVQPSISRWVKKCTRRTRVETDGSSCLIRSSRPRSCSFRDSFMAEKRASLFGKCLKSRASDTPAASANSRVVVPSKPFAAKTRRTAQDRGPALFAGEFLTEFRSAHTLGGHTCKCMLTYVSGQPEISISRVCSLPFRKSALSCGKEQLERGLHLIPERVVAGRPWWARSPVQRRRIGFNRAKELTNDPQARIR